MGNQYSAIPEEKKVVKQFTEEQIILLDKFNANSFITREHNSFVVSIPFECCRLKIRTFEFEPDGNLDKEFTEVKKALDFTNNKLIPRLHELFTFEDE